VFYVIAHFVIRPIFWVLFRPRVTGREHVPSTGPVILASNHLSFIDSIAIPIARRANPETSDARLSGNSRPKSRPAHDPPPIAHAATRAKRAPGVHPIDSPQTLV